MKKYPYDAGLFIIWCFFSISSLVLLTMVAQVLDGDLAVSFLVMACTLHLVLLPAYVFRKKLGHPSWVMLPSVLPATIIFLAISPYFAILGYYTTTGCVLYTCLSLSICVPFLVYRISIFKGVLIACALVVAFTFTWHEMTTSRGKFLRDLNRIKPGMTVEVVDTIMAKYMQGTDLPVHPVASINNNVLIDLGSGQQYNTVDNSEGEIEIVDSKVYRHSDEGAYNADWGIVEFEDGQVTSIHFSPD